MRERQVASEATAFTFDLAKGRISSWSMPRAARGELKRRWSGRWRARWTRWIGRSERGRGGTGRGIDRVAAGHLDAVRRRAGGQALDVATYLGDPREINRQSERYRAVTAERVSALAGELLGPDNRVALLYVPRPVVASEPALAAAAATR